MMSSIRHHSLLIEMYQLRSMILESRLDFLQSTYVPKLVSMLKNQINIIPKQIVMQFYTKLKKNKRNIEDITDEDRTEVCQQTFDWIASKDPDPTKKYTQWLLTTYTRKNDRTPPEDIEYADEVLKKYIELKKDHPELNDINKFKTVKELNAAINDTELSRFESNIALEQSMLNQCDIIYDDDRYRIIVPKTEEAAGYFGRDTEWCTAYGSHYGRYPTRTSYFDDYNKRGPLYIIEDKIKHHIWQFHFETNQMMDRNDIRINDHVFWETHRDLLEIIKHTPLFKKYPMYFFHYIEQPDEDLLKEVAKKSPRYILDLMHDKNYKPSQEIVRLCLTTDVELTGAFGRAGVEFDDITKLEIVNSGKVTGLLQLLRLYKDNNFKELGIEDNPYDLNEHLQRKIINNYFNGFTQLIQNDFVPTKEIQEEAIRKNGLNIIKMLKSKNPDLIPSEEMQIIALSDEFLNNLELKTIYDYLIKYLVELSPEVKAEFHKSINRNNENRKT